jgi:hypothetical protein
MPAHDIVLRAHWEPLPEEEEEVTPPVPTPETTTTPPPDVEDPPPETTPDPPAGSTEEPPVIDEPPQQTPTTPDDREIVEMGPLGVPTGSSGAGDVWSLLSLILSLIAFAVGVGSVIAAALRKQSDEDMWSSDERRERRRRKTRRTFRTLSVATGSLVGIVWLLLDDLTNPMAWINRWTIFVFIAFLVFLVCFVVCKLAKRKTDDENATDRDGGTRYEALNALYDREGWRASDDRWRVNRGNDRFRTAAILTGILSVIGVVIWILLAQRGIPSMQLGGVCFLVCFGIPGLVAGAYDRDWVYLGDDDRPPEQKTVGSPDSRAVW